MKISKSSFLAQQTYTDNEKDTAKAEKELESLVRKGRKQGDSVLIGAAYFYLGACRYDIGDWEGMYSYAYKAVAYLRDTNDYMMVTRAYDLLGYAYEQQENFKMQLDVYKTVDNLIKKHRLGKIPYRTTLNNLASCYHHMGDCKNAIKVQVECLNLHKKLSVDDHTRTMMYSINLAEYYYDNDEPGKALEVLKNVENLIDKTDYRPYILDYYLKLAICAFKLNKPRDLAKYAKKALTYSEPGVYPHQMYDDLRKVSHYILEIGRMDIADSIAELMKEYAAEMTGVTEQLIACRTLAEYYAKKGDEKQAISYYEKLEILHEKYRNELNRVQLSSHIRETGTEAEIQRLKKKLSKTEELAFLDPLSKLLNRSALLRVASDFIDAAAKKKEKIGAIFIDIDFFKQCNDIYGHSKGDEIICEVARACKKEELQFIRFARYGGDELFGITKGLDDDKVLEIAKRICDRIRRADIPNIGNSNGQRVTLSVGVANVPITGQVDTIIEIANYADKALYYAKNTGKNRICVLEHGRKDENGKEAMFVTHLVE